MKSLNSKYIECFKKIKSNWDKIAKPLDSLGKLEDIVAKLGAIQGTEHPSCNKKCLVVLCADNGIVEEGISQSDQSVTRICAENIAAKKTTVGIMAAQAGCDVTVYDVGINFPGEIKNVVNKKIRSGSRNFLKEEAMTKEEVEKAFSIGQEIVAGCKDAGYELICVGEMGIGNTTTSACVAASIFKTGAGFTAGRGAGLSNEGLCKKIYVIDEAIKKYDLHNRNAFEILQIAGGYDIAVMTGIYLAAKKYGMPVILDGAISMTAALVAELIQKGTRDYLIPSHISREPVGKILCDELNLSPVLDAGMALGEGTGAVLFLGILKTALEVYEKSVPFSESNVEQYTRFS